MTLLSLYWICLIVGGSIVGASVLGGGQDSDGDIDHDVDYDFDAGGDVGVDADASVDADADVDADHELETEHGGIDLGIWLPILSLRFWTFSMAFFGLTGVVFSSLTASWLVPLACALGMGLGCGYTAAVSVKLLQRGDVSSHLDASQMRGKIGRVLVGAEAGGRGRIRVEEQGRTLDLSAKMHEAIEMLEGSYVVILKVDDGIAEVMPCPEEALPGKESQRSAISSGRAEARHEVES